jgi:hypothetical protein
VNQSVVAQQIGTEISADTTASD